MSKGITIWLIIILCGIILGLAQLITQARHDSQVNLLKEEIKILEQRLEQVEEEAQLKTQGLKDSFVASPSNKLETTEPEATNAGEI